MQWYNKLPLSCTILLDISVKIPAIWESSNPEAFLSWIKSATKSGLNGFSFKAYRMYLRKISSMPKPVWIQIRCCYERWNSKHVHAHMDEIMVGKKHHIFDESKSKAEKSISFKGMQPIFGNVQHYCLIKCLHRDTLGKP